MADEAQGDLLTEASQTETTSPWFSEENAEVVKRCGWKSADDVIKGYRGLEKDYSGRVKMPSPESSAEEVRAFYQKTGCPENPDGYEIKYPEGMPEVLCLPDEIVTTIKQSAFDTGVNKLAFETTLNAVMQGQWDMLVRGREVGERALKEELGGKYDAELAIARRFCETCSDEFRTLLEKTGLGNNPVFVKEFVAKGKQTLSDTLVRGKPSGGGEEGEEYVPKNLNSPGMYATGEDEESKKARAYFESRGHKY